MFWLLVSSSGRASQFLPAARLVLHTNAQTDPEPR